MTEATSQGLSMMVVAVVVVIIVVLAARALASIWSPRNLDQVGKLVWTLLAVCLPVIGPIAWFTLGSSKSPELK